MIAWGKNKSESRVTAEFYNCAIEVMRGAEAIDQYERPDRAGGLRHRVLARSRRPSSAGMPPEKELDRRIVAVVGAGSGIGQGHRPPAGEGGRARRVRRPRAGGGRGDGQARSSTRYGDGHRRGRDRHQQLRPGDRPRLRHHRPRERRAGCCDEALLAYGGLDAVVVTAGVFVPPDKDGRIADRALVAHLRVNVTGAYIVADEANRIFAAAGPAGQRRAHHQRQRGGGEEGEPGLRHQQGGGQPPRARAGRRDGAARPRQRRGPRDRRQGQHHVPARAGDRVARSSTRYPSPSRDATEELREKLAAFYAERSLIRSPIEPEDQAEAILLLVSERLGKTTGHVIPVDGGLQDGFLR